MDLNPVIIAIPLYFTLMGVEIIYETVTKRKTYRLNDSITNISTGTLQQLTNTFIVFFKIGIYTLVYEQAEVFPLEQNWWTFLLALLFWDFCYYWEHRMAHSISLFWGGHVVHHQSEEFNLSVALRQTSTGFIWGFPFYFPMAILGIGPIQFVMVGGINLIYQFWIHTEHIHKLPAWLELFLNTPSHHRVHHGRDLKYIDKNYAGILIIWDRLFGTFQKEEERPHYGITKPLKSWNPVYANFAHYVELFQQTTEARSPGDALKILFKHPGWLPAYMGGYQKAANVKPDYQNYNVHPGLGIQIYVFFQFFLALIFNVFYFFQNLDFDPFIKVSYAIWIITTTLMFGWLFEWKSRWVIVLELVRLLVIPLGTWTLINQNQIQAWVMVPILIITFTSIVLFLRAFQVQQAKLQEMAKSSSL